MRRYRAWLGVGLMALAGCGRTDREDPDGSGGSIASDGGMGNIGRGGSLAAGGSLATGGSLAAGGSLATGGGIGAGGSLAAGGSSNRGGTMASAGTGGVTLEPPKPTSQLDLLLMIDNSISMADKQQVLSDAISQLLQRLTAPICVDANGASVGVSVNSAGVCLQGRPEFSPVNDIHVGIITSSLGAHGGQTCADAAGDDKAQLLPSIRAPLTAFPYATWNGSGFLAWDPQAQHSPPGEADLATFNANLQNMMASIGQGGCGYEASLEAWYRFLVDPDPPESIPMVTDPSGATQPIIPDRARNQVLLQRAAFLRPNSALAIVLLSDENDCSIRDDGQGWLVGEQNLGGGAFHMPRATSVCEVNPEDKCCVSCAATAPAGCPNLESDPACMAGTYAAAEDNLNLRCWEQKRRFGFDLLYPLSRYVDGLTQLNVVGRDGKSQRNPLFPSGGRTPSMVLLTGIVGVPWQDLASEASWQADAPLEYLNAKELTASDRWSVVLGSPGNATTPPTLPRDALMVETYEDRTMLASAASHPLLGALGALAPSSSMELVNPINGHESNIATLSDLQYACIFPLTTPRDCEAGAAACDCKTTDAGFNRPVCEGTVQTHAKAYPSLRQLAVLKRVGDVTGRALPTSICPKTIGSAGPDTGYGPIVSAMVENLKPLLLP